MGHIRLGKRTDNRNPMIKDFVPLASLDDLVFGGWDPIPDDAYAAAMRPGCSPRRTWRASKTNWRPSSRCRPSSATTG